MISLLRTIASWARRIGETIPAIWEEVRPVISWLWSKWGAIMAAMVALWAAAGPVSREIWERIASFTLPMLPAGGGYQGRAIEMLSFANTVIPLEEAFVLLGTYVGLWLFVLAIRLARWLLGGLWATIKGLG